jgi:hypothetical protein
MEVCIIIAVSNSLVQNALGSDISGPYGNNKCRFPLIIHHLCVSIYGRQKLQWSKTKYENSQLVPAEVENFTFIDTDCQQSNGNYTPQLSRQAIYSKFNSTIQMHDSGKH